jgi:hypothetical protein
MADAYWMQLGQQPTFVLEVGAQFIGIVYWLDAEGLAAGASDDVPLPDSGWYFLAVNRPREPERVAQGHDLRPDMSPEELTQTAEAALEWVANEVLADVGGD